MTREKRLLGTCGRGAPSVGSDSTPGDLTQVSADLGGPSGMSVGDTDIYNSSHGLYQALLGPRTLIHSSTTHPKHFERPLCPGPWVKAEQEGRVSASESQGIWGDKQADTSV